ncbi:MAG TPA: hypothetical protein VKT24_06955 [Rhizomicrobium sp.]|nr:hypothetical protein [Rhizomicrobium sp.]
MILVVSNGDELHAHVIVGKLAERGYRASYLLGSDLLASSQPISITITNEGNCGSFAHGDHRVSLSEAKILWLRRPRAPQVLDASHFSTDAVELVHNDCRLGLNALMTTAFHGKWISRPDATQQASDKVFQLLAAKACGFRIPSTLVSQSKKDIVSFYERQRRDIIVKTLAGINGAFLQTRQLCDPQSLPDNVFALCPAIYQERIPGSDHIRLNTFGANSYAALIRSQELDWRPNLNVPVMAWRVPSELHAKARGVLDKLGLEMGVIDLKITPDGECVWLEVNPQGQFLFLDALTDLRLGDRFVDYLIEEAASVELP